MIIVGSRLDDARGEVLCRLVERELLFGVTEVTEQG